MSFQNGNTVSLIWKRLKKGDYTVKPFPVYKLWEINSQSGSANYYGNYNIGVYRVLYPQNNLYFGGVANISSSLYQRAMPSQSQDPKVLWYYLDHNFYTEYNKDKTPTVLTDTRRVTYLAQSSSLFVIPQSIFGEGIRKGSVRIENYSTTSSRTYSLVDDTHGNLIDEDMSTTSFVDEDSLLMYVGFNEKYRESGIRNKPTNYVLDFGPYAKDVFVSNPKLINYVDGITTTGGLPTGVSADFNGSYLRVDNPEQFNFSKSSNFAISFWINTDYSQSLCVDEYAPLFNKNSMRNVSTLDLQTRFADNTIQYSYTPVYPFDISFTTDKYGANSSKIRFMQSSGISNVEVLSSDITTGSWHHVVCQKSASSYEVWIDGVLDQSQTWVNTNQVQNQNEFLIASDGTSDSLFTGKLDEVRIYNRYLTSTEILGLSNNDYSTGSAYQTNRVGNVFYKHGMVVISDPRPKYHNAGLGNTGNFDYNEAVDGFDLSFRSTTTLFEHEVICKIRKNEYNFTQNPSIRLDRDQSSQVIENYATSSFFNPYITTIGLYNDDYELVAIAKLASPLEKRDDVDMNVIIRWDV